MVSLTRSAPSGLLSLFFSSNIFSSFPFIPTPSSQSLTSLREWDTGFREEEPDEKEHETHEDPTGVSWSHSIPDFEVHQQYEGTCLSTTQVFLCCVIISIQKELVLGCLVMKTQGKNIIVSCLFALFTLHPFIPPVFLFLLNSHGSSSWSFQAISYIQIALFCREGSNFSPQSAPLGLKGLSRVLFRVVFRQTRSTRKEHSHHTKFAENIQLNFIHSFPSSVRHAFEFVSYRFFSRISRFYTFPFFNRIMTHGLRHPNPHVSHDDDKFLPLHLLFLIHLVPLHLPLLVSSPVKKS